MSRWGEITAVMEIYIDDPDKSYQEAMSMFKGERQKWAKSEIDSYFKTDKYNNIDVGYRPNSALKMFINQKYDENVREYTLTFTGELEECEKENMNYIVHWFEDMVEYFHSKECAFVSSFIFKLTTGYETVYLFFNPESDDKVQSQYYKETPKRDTLN